MSTRTNRGLNFDVFGWLVKICFRVDNFKVIVGTRIQTRDEDREVPSVELPDARQLGNQFINSHSLQGAKVMTAFSCWTRPALA